MHAMHVQHATDAIAWDAFLKAQRFSPFLQSWTMGDVYREIGQEPVRLEVRENGVIVGICLAVIVPARRGRHLAIQYGPVITSDGALDALLKVLTDVAREHRCSFIRLSPFWEKSAMPTMAMQALSSPLHLLAEHVWYLPLTTVDPWIQEGTGERRTNEDLMMNMRKTTRNLIRRAEKDGVEVTAAASPLQGLEDFIQLHDQTRRRHKFTPYSNHFFHAQVKHFAARNECTVYLARHEGALLAASVHIHFGGETSYHHGASSFANPKIPTSYALQWKAIQDARSRGDKIYNFWGIAPMHLRGEELVISDEHHPFSGVTLFKMGFGGKLLELTHCMDLPISPSYHFTRWFEFARKWRRGF